MGGDIVWTAGRIASIVRYILFIAREYICMHLQHSFFLGRVVGSIPNIFGQITGEFTTHQDISMGKLSCHICHSYRNAVELCRICVMQLFTPE